MESFSDLLSQGASNAWLFIPTAILLGALHGLEPGHSKTMMAAFIVAVRGTVGQAVLLGISAAFSHSLIIWLLAALALHFGAQWNAEATEPYFQMVSGVIIIGLAAWMFWRTRRDRAAATGHSHDHGHDGDGPHGGQVINTGHGLVEVSVFESGVPPRFRLYFFDVRRNPSRVPAGENVVIETERPDGEVESFAFVARGEYLEAATELAEPHEFDGLLRLSHGDHAHDYEFIFAEHGHGHHEHAGLDVSDGGFQDAHELAHAADIARRFANRAVTTPQIVLFGLTGGLMPCPAAFTILLICLQLKRFVLGFTLVICFSIGLAITMVAVGVAAAWGTQHASKKFKGFNELARKAPYFSSAVLTLLGIYIGVQGLIHIR